MYIDKEVHGTIVNQQIGTQYNSKPKLGNWSTQVHLELENSNKTA